MCTVVQSVLCVAYTVSYCMIDRMASRGVITDPVSNDTDPDAGTIEPSEMSFSVNGGMLITFNKYSDTRTRITFFYPLSLLFFFFCFFNPIAASANDKPVSLQPESNPFEYHCYGHPLTVLESFTQLYESRSLTDVNLTAGESTFAAHRVVLAAGSAYFNAMFTNAHIESTQDHIVLNGMDGNSLGLLLNFLYTSKLSITEDNVQNLLAAASLLHITAVVEACCQFLLVRLEPDNCLGICNFADMHGCSSLLEVSWDYALQHFQEVSVTEEFLSMPATLLEKLFRSESLQVQSEEEVLDALLLWYQHDSPARHEAFVSLLHYIKLPLIPYLILNQKLLSIPLIANDVKCQKLITSAKTYQNDTSEQPLLHMTTDFNPYAARKFHRQLIYVIGGETDPGRSMVATVEEYNPVKETWTQLKPLSNSRRGVGVSILEGLLYAIGGSDGLQALQLVERYNPEMNTWMRVADLNEVRSSVAAAVIDDVLYAVGGYDGIMNCLCTVERYDLVKDAWTYVKPMNTPRSMVSVGVVDKQMYVVGGYDGGSDLSSCEVYNSETDTWTMIKPMNYCRCMAGVGVIENLLYAVGGCDCAKSLNSAEVYDPEKDVWTVISEMSEARSGLGVAVVGPSLYAVGGYTGTAYCNSVEKFDTTIGQWVKLANMASGRRRFGCCS